MTQKKEQDTFSYTYSAKEQEELKEIMQKYQPKEESKMDKIRKMDAGVTRTATMTALGLGVIGALILGAGMSLIMTDLGNWLGLTGVFGMVVGIFFGMVGIVLLCLAYPVYAVVLKKEREKIAPELLQMSREMMK